MRTATALCFVLSITFCSPAGAQQRKAKPNREAERRGPPPYVPEPSGPRLRDLAPADGSFPIFIGASSHEKYLGTESETILDREFAFVTPGNDFKQSGIHPEPNVWKWSKADVWIEHCAANNQIMRLHSAISPQCSTWAKDDRRTGEQLKQNLEEFMTALCKRYNGEPHVKWMDVVNETVTREGEWFGPREGNERWESPWTQIGFDESHPLKPPLYIKQAFEIANKHAPNIKQIINQHGGMEQPMWRKVAKTAMYLRDKGLRIDGIGWQAHVDAGFEKDPQNMTSLNALVAWAHSHDLEFHVTENTIWLRDQYENDYEAQAETCRSILRTLISHSANGVVSWNAWQIRDTETQHPERKGCLFDADARPKPAYYAVQSELKQLSISRRKQDAP